MGASRPRRRLSALVCAGEDDAPDAVLQDILGGKDSAVRQLPPGRDPPRSRGTDTTYSEHCHVYLALCAPGYLVVVEATNNHLPPKCMMPCGEQIHQTTHVGRYRGDATLVFVTH